MRTFGPLLCYCVHGRPAAGHLLLPNKTPRFIINQSKEPPSQLWIHITWKLWRSLCAFEIVFFFFLCVCVCVFSARFYYSRLFFLISCVGFCYCLRCYICRLHLRFCLLFGTFWPMLCVRGTCACVRLSRKFYLYLLRENCYHRK